MFSTMRGSVGVALCSAGLALLLLADQARAQMGSCQGHQNGQTGSQQTGQMTPAQLQTMLQQLQSAQGGQLTPSQLQTLLQQIQSGPAGMQTTGSLTSSQVPTGYQQLPNGLQSTSQLTPAQLQGLPFQRQFGTGGLGQGGQLTPFQMQMLLQQQNAQALQLRALQLRGRR